MGLKGFICGRNNSYFFSLYRGRRGEYLMCSDLQGNLQTWIRPFHSPTPSKTVEYGRSRKGKILKTSFGYPNGINASCANWGEHLVDRYIPWAGEESPESVKGWIKWVIIKAWYYQNPLLQPGCWTAGFWGAIVGPNNLWARPTCSWGVQRPKPKKVMARAQKYKAKNGPEMQPRTV